MLVDSLRRCGVQNPDVIADALEKGEFDDVIDWGEGSDVPVDSSCDLESPEECESCQ